MLDPREVDEHVRRTIERLRTQRSFRRHLGGAKNIGSDSDLSVMGGQNVVNSQIQSGTMLAPVDLVIIFILTTHMRVTETARYLGVAIGRQI